MDNGISWAVRLCLCLKYSQTQPSLQLLITWRPFSDPREMIWWVSGHSSCGQASTLDNCTSAEIPMGGLHPFHRFLDESVDYGHVINIEEKYKEGYVQLFPGSPSLVPVLTGTGLGGLVLAVTWRWVTALPMSLDAHPPPSSPPRGQQKPGEDESKRRQNILLERWRRMDLASNAAVLARSVFCWHILLCQISTWKRNPRKVRGCSHKFEITLIFCWLKPGPSLFISWLNNSQMIGSSSWASLLSL